MGDLMKDDNKTKKQLVHELTELRSQNAALKKSITGAISAELAAEEVGHYAESIVETVREPLLVLYADLKIISANRSFYRTFKVTPGETLGRFIYDIGNKQWDIPKLRELLEEVLPEKEAFDDFEVEHNFQDIGYKIMLLNARRIYRKDIGVKTILLAIEDITEHKRLEDLLTESEELYKGVFKTASDGILLLEKREGKITHTNPAAEKMLGYSKKECIGKRIQDIGIMLDMSDFPMIMHNLDKSGIINYTDVPATTKSGQQIDMDIYLVDKTKLVQCNVRDITDRKQVERSLLENEARLRTLVQTIPDLIWLKDADGVYLACNKRFERFFGAKETDIVGKTDYDFVDKELADFFRDHDRKAMAAGKPSANEEWLTFADDDYRGLFDTIKTPMYDAEGKLTGVLGIARDITKRKRAEEEHKAHVRFLESLERVDQAIKQETDVEQMLWNIIKTVFSIFDCDRAWLLYPCDPDAPSYRVPVEITRPEYPGAKVLNIDVPMSPGEARNMREALESDEPVTYTAGTERPIMTAKQFGVQSQMFIPVYPKLGDPWMFGMHQCSYPRNWTEEEQKLFKEIGRRMSDGLSTVLFLRELQEREERYRKVFENHAAVKLLIDPDTGSIIEANEAAVNYYGWSHEQLRQMKIHEINTLPPEDVKKEMEKARTQKRIHFEFRHRWADGSIRDVEVFSSKIEVKGKDILHSIIHDITDRKRTEEALHVADMYNRSLIEASLDPLVTIGADGKITDVNAATEAVTGYTRIELIGTEFPDYFTEPEQARAGYQEVFREGFVRDHPLELRHRDGHVISVLYNASVYRDEKGQVAGVFAAARDITERKRAEEALSKSEGRLHALVQTIPDLIWLKDKDGVYLSCNRMFERFFGAREADIVGKTDYDFVGRELADFFREHDRKAMAAGKPTSNEEWITFADDGHRALLDTIKTPMYDAQGTLVGVLGIGRDITERKRAEDMLRISEGRYRMAEAIGHVGNWEYNLQTTKFWGSDEAKRIYGFDPEALDFSTDEVENCIPERERVHQALVDLIEADKPYNLEFEIHPKNSLNPRIISSVAELKRDEHGNPLLVTGFIQDITERKQAEEELSRMNRALRMLSDSNQALIHITDEATLLNEVCRIAVDVGGYRLAWVGFAENDEAKTVRPVAHAGFESGYIESANVTWADNERGRGPGGTAIRTGQPCIARNIPVDPAFAPWRQAAIQRGYKSNIALPLISEGQTLGELAIYSVETDAFDIKEVEVLKELAEDLAFGIIVLRTRAKRDLAEEALWHSEKEKTIRNQIANVFLTISDEEVYGEILGIVLRVMKSRFGIFGYIGGKGDLVIPSLTREIWRECQVPGKSIVFPSDSWGDSLWGRAIREKKSFSSDGPFLTPEGHVRIDHFLTVPVVYGQESIGLISVANKEGGYTNDDKDLLERIASYVSPILNARLQRDRQERKRKQAEEALVTSESKYRNIFENAMEGIYQAIPEGRYKAVNTAFARMAGYDSPEELIESIEDIGTQLYVHPEDRKKFLEIMATRGIVDGFEVELIKKNGSMFWGRVNSRAIKDDQGEILYFEGIVEDITPRKQAEGKLLQTLDSLRRAFSATVQVLVSAVESRDPYTAGHQIRSANLARAIAMEMGLSQERIDGIRMAGSIHDIGKLSIPAEILSTPKKLTELEFSMIKEHANKGFEMLKDVESPWPLSEIVYQHHERMDGSGYPRHLKGEEILIEARIMAVADVVEAMASHRPYRVALGLNAALAEIENNKGTLYDADAVDACLRLFREKGFQLEGA